ncbi:MAG: MEDS domain-containing protein [Nitrosopumilus sp.]|nr:MEDS domain-containing protein [Nitrosopumilus sp.]
MPRLSRNIINASPEEFLHDLKPGQHGCVFFFTKEEMHHIQFAFVKSGLDSNWGVVYLSATESIAKLRKLMQKYGIDVHQYEKESGDGSLIILKGDDLYKNPDNPDIDNWINATKSISDMFISKGKKGVRVAADLSAYFISRGLVEQWHNLEHALGKKPLLPMSILCAYDSGSSKTWDADVLKFYAQLNPTTKEFVDAHSFVIYASKQKSVIFTI